MPEKQSTPSQTAAATYQVPFQDDNLMVIESEDLTRYVPLRQVCNLLGLDWSAQVQRIHRHPVFSQKSVEVSVSTPGGTQNLLCLDLELFHGWLLGISASRVDPAVQEKLIRYQTEAYEVLADYFLRGFAYNPRFETLKYKLEHKNLIKFLAENTTNLSSADLVKAAFVRAVDGIESTQQGLYFLADACALYRTCQEDCRSLIGKGPLGKAVPMKKRNMNIYADLIKCVLDTGVALHRHEIEAMAGTKDVSPLIDKLLEEGYWLSRTDTGLFRKSPDCPTT